MSTIYQSSNWITQASSCYFLVTRVGSLASSLIKTKQLLLQADSEPGDFTGSSEPNLRRPLLVNCSSTGPQPHIQTCPLLTWKITSRSLIQLKDQVGILQDSKDTNYLSSYISITNVLESMNIKVDTNRCWMPSTYCLMAICLFSWTSRHPCSIISNSPQRLTKQFYLHILIICLHIRRT